jgi:hypothetical protein
MNSWAIFRFSKVRGITNFEDLSSVIISAGCYPKYGTAVWNVIEGTNCTVYTYGRELLLAINFLHINVEQTNILGICNIFLILFLLSHTVSRIPQLRKADSVVAFLVLINPGTLFLFERGNFDGLIFLLIYLSAYFAYKKKFKVSALLILFSALAKFYTLPLLLLFLFIKNNKLEKIFSLSLLVITTPVLLWEMSKVSYFPSTWNLSWGSPAFSLWINLFLKKTNLTQYEISKLPGQLMGIIIFISLIRLLWNKYSSELQFKFKKDQSENLHFLTSIYVFFSSTFLVCYLAGINFDYRLALVSMSFLLFPHLFDMESRLKKFIQLVTILACWSTGLIYPMVMKGSYALQALSIIPQLIQNLCITFLAALITISLWKISSSSSSNSIEFELPKQFSNLAVRISNSRKEKKFRQD